MALTRGVVKTRPVQVRHIRRQLLYVAGARSLVPLVAPPENAQVVIRAEVLDAHVVDLGRIAVTAADDLEGEAAEKEGIHSRAAHDVDGQLALLVAAPLREKRGRQPHLVPGDVVDGAVHDGAEGGHVVVEAEDVGRVFVTVAPHDAVLAAHLRLGRRDDVRLDVPVYGPEEHRDGGIIVYTAHIVLVCHIVPRWPSDRPLWRGRRRTRCRLRWPCIRTRRA